jgi:hypothetical protein
VPPELLAQGVVATSDDPWVIACLAKYAERDRLKAEQIEAEKLEIAEFQKTQKQDWLDQLNHPRTPSGSGSSGSGSGLSKADFDVDDTRIAKESVRDGYFVEEIKPTNEAAHNLTLDNF